MKSFIFENAQSTFALEFKTDHLDGHDNFTVHDLKLTSPSGTVTEGNLVRTGLNYTILPYTVAAFTAYATDNNLNLTELNFSTGETDALVTGAADNLDITTISLTNGTDATPYSEQIVVAGGFPEYSFALTAGDLPAGITLDTRTGLLSGTPEGAGAETFTITATDLTEQTDAQELTLTIDA